MHLSPWWLLVAPLHLCYPPKSFKSSQVRQCTISHTILLLLLAAVGLSKSHKGRGRPLFPFPWPQPRPRVPAPGSPNPFIARPLWGSINLLITTYGILSPSHVVFDQPFLGQSADRLQTAPIALFWERFSFQVHLTRPGSFLFTRTPLTGSKT